MTYLWIVPKCSWRHVKGFGESSQCPLFQAQMDIFDFGLRFQVNTQVEESDVGFNPHLTTLMSFRKNAEPLRAWDERVAVSWLLEELRYATHSSILVWRIPWTEWTEEAGGLQSMGVQRVGQD